MSQMTEQGKVSAMMDYGYEMQDIVARSGLSAATIYKARRGGALHASSVRKIETAWQLVLADLEQEARWDSFGY